MPQHPTPQTVTVTFDPEIDAYCPACDYNLLATTGSSCPECGTLFSFAFAQTKSRYGLYLIGFACLSNIVLSGLYYIPFLVRDIIEGSLRYDPPGQIVTYWGIVVLAVPLQITAIFHRKAIIRASVRQRIAWTAIPVFMVVLQAATGYYAFL